MPRFIEQFYYGNLEPQERSNPQPPTTRKQMDILVLNEELLTKVLTDKEKERSLELFLVYVDAWHEVNSESNLDSFIMGFRLGAHFAFDTFAGSETPFGEI